MSRADDRIPVPGNGHRPPLTDDEGTSGSSPTPTADEPRITFTPGQVAVGFGIIASLILLAAGRRRRRGRDA